MVHGWTKWASNSCRYPLVRKGPNFLFVIAPTNDQLNQAIHQWTKWCGAFDLTTALSTRECHPLELDEI